MALYNFCKQTQTSNENNMRSQNAWAFSDFLCNLTLIFERYVCRILADGVLTLGLTPLYCSSFSHPCWPALTLHLLFHSWWCIHHHNATFYRRNLQVYWLQSVFISKVRARAILALIFSSELKPAHESRWVQSPCAVGDHTVHKPDWASIEERSHRGEGGGLFKAVSN